VHDLHEGGESGLAGGLEQVGTVDGLLQVGNISARAALSLATTTTLLGLAGRTLAHKLALGLGAGDGLLALPVALGGLAHGGAHSVGGLALSAAVGRRADGLALGAVLLLAQVLGAAHVALRLVAVNLALSTLSLLAVNLALRTLADRVALGRAHWVITLPSALRVAVSFYLSNSLHEVGGSGDIAESQ